MQEDITLDPGISAVEVEHIVTGAGEHVVDELHNRCRPVAAGEIDHVIITIRRAKKVAEEDSLSATLDAARAMRRSKAAVGVGNTQ